MKFIRVYMATDRGLIERWFNTNHIRSIFKTDMWDHEKDATIMGVWGIESESPVAVYIKDPTVKELAELFFETQPPKKKNAAKP